MKVLTSINNTDAMSDSSSESNSEEPSQHVVSYSQPFEAFKVVF